MRKVYFITGAARGLGVDLAKAALAAGHAVVAAARKPESIAAAIGEDDDLLAVQLDITDAAAAEVAVRAGVEKFGRIDVLINNAGNFYAGFFEETSPAQFRAQIETNLFGTLNVTRAILPVMRQQGSGTVVTISSSAGAAGGEFVSAYCASKFAIEGWMESLAPEVAPLGIRTMIVEPGMFRTELLEPQSTTWGELSVSDYAERTAQVIPGWKAASGTQPGDPAKLARALVQLAGSNQPPIRFAAGADAVDTVERKARALLSQVDAYRSLSLELSHDETGQA